MITIPPYLHNPDEIYAESFRQITALIDLSPYPKILHPVIIRLIHSTGRPEILPSLRYSKSWQEAPLSLSQLTTLTHIFTDSEMTRHGIIEQNLPKNIQIECTLNDPETPSHAQKLQTTRSAAALDFWHAEAKQFIAVIGNAPTALFYLLEKMQTNLLDPFLIIAFPVGFVGAAEAKNCLIENADILHCHWLSLTGREGGSALAAAAINGLFCQNKQLK